MQLPDYWVQLKVAKRIKASLGVRCAAGYMRNHGWTLAQALFWLLGRELNEEADSTAGTVPCEQR